MKVLKYVKHHITFNWQYLYKTNLESSLDVNSIFIHWDFINNPIVKYYQQLQNHWGTQCKFAYLIGIEKIKQQDCIQTTTISYFIKDPKHDFSAAHHVIRKYCIQKQSDWH